VILTASQLSAAMPYAGERVPIYVEALNHAMLEFGIDSPQRQACFLAQVAHESGSLRYTREIADGSAYEGRKDLGNTHVGDGPRFKGRGLLQITGRANYEKCGFALARNLVSDPTYLETPMGASRSAAWFWSAHGLNELADSESFGAITKRINGGYNGLDERFRYYLRIRKVLGL
jgi:putative chitinase